jgi:hypothetical protein
MPGLALMSAPEPITSPVPEKWRNPYIKYLASLGVKDSEAVADHTRFAPIGGPASYKSDSVIFRIEDKNACHEDICLTFVGRLVDDRLVVDAQFTAGPKITWSDTGRQALPGMFAFPLYFEGSTGTSALFETATGWIVIPPSK